MPYDWEDFEKEEFARRWPWLNYEYVRKILDKATPEERQALRRSMLVDRIVELTKQECEAEGEGSPDPTHVVDSAADTVSRPRKPRQPRKKK